MRFSPEDFLLLSDIAAYIAKKTGKLPDMTIEESSPPRSIYFEIVLPMEDAK